LLVNEDSELDDMLDAMLNEFEDAEFDDEFNELANDIVDINIVINTISASKILLFCIFYRLYIYASILKKSFKLNAININDNYG